MADTFPEPTMHADLVSRYRAAAESLVSEVERLNRVASQLGHLPEHRMTVPAAERLVFTRLEVVGLSDFLELLLHRLEE